MKSSRPDERDELRLPLGPCPLERADQQLELPVTAHEPRVAPLLDVDAEAGLRGDGLPDGDRIGLSLCHDWVGGGALEHPLGGAEGLLADEDTVHGRCRLEPGGGVHHVAGRHPLSRARTRVEGDERLTGVDRHPDVQARSASSAFSSATAS